jgi:replicative DNA helicase
MEIDLMGKIPPSAPDVESVVIGTILLYPESFYRVKKILSKNAFFQEDLNIIYQTFFEMDKEGEPIDIVTVTDKLRKKNKLDKVGGPAKIATLSERIATNHNIKKHAMIIQQYYLQRKIIQILEEMMKSAYKLDIYSANDLLDLWEEKTEPIRNYLNKLNVDNQSIGNVVEKVVKQTKGEIPQDEKVITNTFFDNIMVLGQGEVIYLAAAPKHGKSKLLITLAYFLLQLKDTAVMMYSMEDSAMKIIRNMIAIITGISHEDQTRTLSQQQLESVICAAHDIQTNESFIIKNSKISINKIKSDYIDFVHKNKNKKCFLFIDNFAHPRDLSFAKSDNAKDEEIAAGIDRIKYESNIDAWSCIIVADHLNKSAQSKLNKDEGYRPKQEHLVGSQRKYAMLTQLVFANKPSMYSDLMSEERNLPKIKINNKYYSRENILKKLVVIENTATRDFSKTGKIKRLYYDMGTMQFKNLKEL